MQETACSAGNLGSSLGCEYSVEKEMATHSSVLAWESHGQRSLAGYSPWGRKESNMTELLTQYIYTSIYFYFQKRYTLHTSLSVYVCLSIYWSVCLSSYWVGHKICSGFSVRCYEKLEQTFWPTQYLTSYWNIFFSLYTIWMTVSGPKVLQLLIFKEYNTALTLPYFVWRTHFLFFFF